MADAPLALASAVILPETEEQPQPPTLALKRRQSSTSEAGSKRPKLSQNGSVNGQNSTAMSPPQSGREGRISDQRKNGHIQEERKRGQRLFGALLGTLSQSSSSTANKRRADIEKKQQAKLRLQTEQENERKEARLEDLVAKRRKEQKIYDRQSMQIRHSNALSQAHFLRTKTEPRLYYKPWEFLPGEEDKIKDQVKEARETIDQESSQYNIDHPTSPRDSPPDEHLIVKRKSKEDTAEDQETDGKDADTTKFKATEINGTDTNDAALLDAQQPPPDPQEAPRDTGDDGGEVVEGEEDTVIY